MLRFIITINKFPRQTLGRLGVFMIPKLEIAHNRQMHVITISTARDENGLNIFVAGAAKQQTRFEIKNVVLPV